MKAVGFLRERLFEGIEAIPAGLEAGALVARLREENARLLEEIGARANGPWFPGKGRLLSRALAGLKTAAARKVLETMRWDGRALAVVALGGLGRGELAPGSDLDLLILHARGARVGEFARGFLYALWDAGFEVTASTRTVGESLAHAAEDDTFFTALLSARLLSGSRALYERLMRRFSRRLRSRGKKLVAGWLAETRDNANGERDGRPPLFAKEPNLKKAPGGVRAVHLIEWTAALERRSPGFPDLARCLSPEELERLEPARDFILLLRILLHFRTGGKEDTLALDGQLAVARSLGLAGDDLDRIRSLMRFYYKKTLAINRILFRFLEAAWLASRPGPCRFLARRRRASVYRIGRALYANPHLPPSPAAAFDLLERLGRERLAFSASVAAYLERCARSLGEDDWRPFLAERFLPLLGLDRAARSLRAMHFSGLLDAVLPVLRPVRLFYLYSPAHLLPVDAHSLEAAAALESLYAGELPASAPRFVSRVREVADLYREKAWVLKLALLVHDAGKGFPGDHVKNGVDEAARFLPFLGLGRQYLAAVLFLIEHHLLLSSAVRRRDTTDPRLLAELARVFVLAPYPEEYLDLLFVFTFADVWATNPKNYNGYFALALTRVYQKVREIVLAEPRGAGTAGGAGGGGADEFARALGERYLENNDDDAVSRDREILSGLAPDGFALAVHAGSEYVRVKFYAPDRPGLFALLCGILSLNGAAIVRADIHTWRGKALDEFFITRIFESETDVLSDAADAARWEAALRRDYSAFRDDPGGLSARLAALRRKTGGLGARFTHPARVEIAPGEAGGARIEVSGRERPAMLFDPARVPAPGGAIVRIEVSGRDRPALLFDLARALARGGANVRSAIVDTAGWSVHDVFEVKFDEGADPAKREALVLTLRQVLEPEHHQDAPLAKTKN